MSIDEKNNSKCKNNDLTEIKELLQDPKEDLQKSEIPKKTESSAEKNEIQNVKTAENQIKEVEKIDKNELPQLIKNNDEESNESITKLIAKDQDKSIKKKDWSTWSSQEKILFYEIIANGENYSSLQKLFKKMNFVNFIFYIFLIDYWN